MKKVVLYEQLIKALLAELASGLYREGQRFISKRKICKRWKISDPTALSALRWLVERGLIEARPRSGYYVSGQSQKDALLHLPRMRTLPLAQQPGWESRRIVLRRALGRPLSQRTIAVIAPGPAESPARLRDLAKAPLLRSFTRVDGVFEAARHHGAALEFFVDNGRPKRRQEIARQILDLKPSGVIAFRRLVSYVPLQPMLDALVKADVPVVTVFDDCEGHNVHSINLNNVAIGYDVARRLLRLGHRRLAVILPETTGCYFSDRALGCAQAFREAKVPAPNLLTLRLPLTTSSRPMLRRMLTDREKRPTAFFLTTVTFLPQLWQALKERRLAVPRDVSIVATAGARRIPESPRAVDTVLINFPQIGELAFRTLMAVLDGKVVDRSTFVRVRYNASGTVAKAPIERADGPGGRSSATCANPIG
ncbi:MAG: GntR family transcriptional regulator [Verrucomicrobiae bacterium]|nr:GntR family transcriptional regulator [Verrucomicrobiae bacterium]